MSRFDYPNIIIEKGGGSTRHVCIMGEIAWVRIQSFYGESAMDDSWEFASKLGIALNRLIGSDFGMGGQAYAKLGTSFWEPGLDRPEGFVGNPESDQ